ncbi:MAG: RluA family pseudouridine synthase, partial [Oscillibacter sp.]|nr:RluA family pseudouridine synthase [Oscillibacter sp.]
MTAHASNFSPGDPTVAGALAYLRGAEGGLVTKNGQGSNCGQEADCGPELESNCGQEADCGLELESNCGQETDCRLESDFFRGTNFVFHPVNRLDRGTTGLMVVAKSGYIHDRLRRLLHTDAFRRTYRAVTVGVPVPESGTIDAPVGRDERSLVARMVRPDGKPAVTHFRTLASGTWTDGTVLSLVELYPEAGRTHQLRVHMAHMGCPLAGDWLYGREDPSLIGRPALHAYRLELVHPVTGERLKLEAPLPPDMARLTQEISRTEGDNNHGNDRQTVSG